MSSRLRKPTFIALALLLVLQAFPLAASDPSPGAAVDRYFAAYSSMDPDRMLDVYAFNAVFEDVLQRHRMDGAEAIRDYVGQIAGLHDSMGVREESRVISGNVVAVKFLYTGKVSGEALRKATGKETCRDVSYEIPAMSWFVVEKGRILRQTDFLDVQTLQEVQAKASGQTP